MERDREAFEAWVARLGLDAARGEFGEYVNRELDLGLAAYRQGRADGQVALAYVERVEGWQDISSAPKDGTIFLGFYPRFWVAGGRGDWANPERLWCVGATRWDGDDDLWRWHTLDGDAGYEPTHWRPLPPPPSTVTESSGCVFRDLNVSPPEKE